MKAIVKRNETDVPGSPSEARPESGGRLIGLRHLKLPRRGNRSVWAAVAAVLMLAGTLGAALGARAVARSDADKARLAFHLASAEIASSLKQAIQHEEDLVVSASAFVSGNPSASPADFDRWSESVHALQRYPELQNIGLVTLVPASQLPAFESRLAANPVRPMGPRSVAAAGSFQILPPGKRSYYCFAVAGLARSATTYLPPGVDYCALSPQLILDREVGLTGYAPLVEGKTVTLGVVTPVYRGGAVPAVSNRKRAFIGWLGELLEPNVVLKSALQGHPSLAVTFRYDSRFSHVAFTSGVAPAGAQSTMINLLVGREALGNEHEGWTVQTFGAPASTGVLANGNSLTLLTGGSLVSVMLGLLVLILSTERMRALSLVREKTGELSQKNRELSYQATHDMLTGLPNRALVLDRAEQLLARAARQRDVLAGALFIDVDGFKHVNDNLGHAAGDRLLRTVAERLRGAVRDQDTVGRLGGDEFVVLGEVSSGETALDILADRLIQILREPVEVDEAGKTVSITASIGVAVGQYASPDALLRDADLALYAAKEAGKDRHVLFGAGMHERAGHRQELAPDLRTAVQDGQLFLVYQPIFDLPSRQLAGVEALVRWHHPQLGLVLPGDFIPMAEESGLIGEIGEWVLEEACRQTAAWAAQGRRIGVSVNVSASQLGQSRLVEDVRGALATSGIAPSLLTLEITETALVRDVRSACEHLEAIRALGVRIAIDDFGTGYASLSHLQRLPVDILKIDMSFVSALSGGWSRELLRANELLQAILGVGQALSLAVIAEGIEEQGQVAALEAMGCEMGQGFLLGRPGTAAAIESLLGPRAAPRAIGVSAT
jgi:diguanylate cyclase (GGDEF)-like protein